MAVAGLRSWHTMRVDANLTFLPQTLDLSPSRAGAVILIAFGGIWVGGLAFMVLEAAPSATEELLVLSVMALIGVAIAGWGVSQLFRKRRAVLSKDGVEVTGRGLLGSEKWYQPYGAYEGVLHRRVVIRSKNSTRVYQVIELLHEDRDKCIPLFVRRGSDMPRNRWEEFAKQLRLPALEIAEGALVRRGHEDLDKPLKEQVAEGTVGHDFDPEAPAPAGLVVTRDHANAFTIDITAPRYPLWFLGIFIAVGLGLVTGSFLGEDNPVLLFVVGVIFGGLATYMLYRDRTSPRSLKLDRERLVLDDAMQGRRRDPKTLPFDQIESITLRAEDGNMGQALVIAGDSGQMKVGSGLSKPALVWLKNFLTAAIATA